MKASLCNDFRFISAISSLYKGRKYSKHTYCTSSSKCVLRSVSVLVLLAVECFMAPSLSRLVKSRSKACVSNREVYRIMRVQSFVAFFRISAAHLTCTLQRHEGGSFFIRIHVPRPFDSDNLWNKFPKQEVKEEKNTFQYSIVSCKNVLKQGWAEHSYCTC